MVFTDLTGKFKMLTAAFLVVIVAFGLLSAVSTSADERELTGTVTYDKEKLLLNSGKEKVVLVTLPPGALDSMNFQPAGADTLKVTGSMSKGALVVREAVWKQATYVFRDRLNQPLISGPGTWKVVAEDCIGCKLCTFFCPVGAITMQQTDQGVKAVIDPEQCTGCNICITGNRQKFNGCPTGAIKR